MNLVALPAFTDNYIWMLDDGRRCIVVDPGDGAVVVDALTSRGLQLAGILVTHHHGDHVGGLALLRDHLHGPVYGPATEAIPPPFTPVRGGDRVELLGMAFEVIDVPGHTAGHIAYVEHPAPGVPGATRQAGPGPARGGPALGPGASPGQQPLLFCGDTLFSGGCGRLFEGTPAQMHASLQALAALPGDTRVCCAHEYTLSNLRFAEAVEPANAELARYVGWCRAQREHGRPTLPSSIATERAVNPFLRCTVPAVVQSALSHGAASDGAVDVLAALRHWKNEFR